MALCKGIHYLSLVGLIDKALSQTLPRVKSVQGKVVVCVCLYISSFPLVLFGLLAVKVLSTLSGRAGFNLSEGNKEISKRYD